MEYDEFVKKKLEKSPFIRHLFARIGKEVTIETTTKKVRGILKSIDISYRWFEVEEQQVDGKTYFIKWDHIIYLSSEKVI